MALQYYAQFIPTFQISTESRFHPTRNRHVAAIAAQHFARSTVRRHALPDPSAARHEERERSSKTPSAALSNFTAPQPSRAGNFVEEPTVSPTLTLDVSMQCFESGITGPNFTGDLPFPAFAANARPCGCAACRTEEDFPKAEIFQAQAKVFEWRDGK
jgi:hypothetical protein